jgi:tetratricopeptide (TPR) repeat protein
MLVGMKPFTVFVYVVLCAFPLRAQESVSHQVVRGFDLWRAGQAKAAIAVLEPLTAPDTKFPDSRSRGVTWSVLGSSYLDAERFDEARRAYQHAIEILQPLADARSEYAAALDNLGVLEQSLNQYRTAQSLCQKAQHIYQELGDASGLAITSTNLAVNAYVQGNYKAAERAVGKAREETKHTTEMREDDMAALETVETALALHDRRNEQAMASIGSAIERWTRIYGPDYHMLVNAYLLRAQAMAASGDPTNAIADAKRALDRAESLWGRNSVGYFNAQGSYAQVLRMCGETGQARRLATEAAQGLSDLERRQCSGCTVNARAFR